MNLTNKHNLPEPVMNAVRNMTGSYNRGPVFSSISELEQPTRISVLRRRHDSEITEDISNMLPMLDGHLMHLMLEQAGDETGIVEERLTWPIRNLKTGQTWLISGKPDHASSPEALTLDAGSILSDYKFSSVWTAVHALKEGVKPDWKWQLHGYRLGLWKARGIQVTKMQIILRMRDWSRTRAKRERDLPQEGVVSINVPIEHTNEEVEAYFADKAAAMDAGMNGGELPLCTAEERWERPTAWAVKKPENKRATSLHETAESASAALKPGMIIEKRPGLSVRCAEGYCPVSDYCDWWQRQSAALQGE